MERCGQQTLSGGLRIKMPGAMYQTKLELARFLVLYLFILLIISNLPGWKGPGGSQEVQHRGGSCSSERKRTRKRSQLGLCQ